MNNNEEYGVKSQGAFRSLVDQKEKKISHLKIKKTLIIGAGSAGSIIAAQLFRDKSTNLLPVGFIDDDRMKNEVEIIGIPVIGVTSQILTLVNKFNIACLIIAIPSIDRTNYTRILRECLKTDAQILKLPMLKDIETGRLSNQLSNVHVEELLGRDTITLETKEIYSITKGKTVLVTGAGGSIGSEICRQIIKAEPSQLILVGHGENSIYSTELELLELKENKSIRIIPIIADVQDKKKIKKVIEMYRPNVIYHAAAHKHVPMMENNPDAALKNNTIGTWNVAEAAGQLSVEKFVLISTDKAVKPTSVMGASKRLAEMLIQHLNKHYETQYISVRFGNVLGSRGSVIPRFTNQILKGGPVTVTHPDMERYFMTIPEAAKLVIQASVLGQGGEIFVLDMGKPIKIVDLAKNLIQLSGHSIDEIGISFTGIRPGEKLHEELLDELEIQEKQIYPKIYLGRQTQIFIKDIEDLITNYPTYDAQQLKTRMLEIANQRPQPHNLVSTG